MKQYLESNGIQVPLHILTGRIAAELIGFCLLLTPSLLTLYLTDHWIEKGREMPLYWCFLAFSGAVLIHLYRYYFVNYRAQVYVNGLAADYRMSIARKVICSAIPAYEAQSKAKITNMVNDVSAIYSLGNYLILVPVDLIKVLIVILLLFSAHHSIALISLVFAPLYLLSSFLNKRRLTQLVAEEKRLGDIWFREADTLINGKVSIHLNHADSYVLGRYQAALKTYNIARNRQHFYLLITQELPRFITTFAPLLILLVGGNQVVRGSMSIGQLLFALQLVGYLFTPLSEIAVAHAQFMSQKPAFDRTRHFLGLPDWQPAGQAAPSTGGIELKNVALLRPNGTPLFHIDRLETPQTGLILIKGENGCGKSSLFNVLSGVFSGEQVQCGPGGVFRIPERFKNDMGYLFYPNFIFPGTVRENILCGRAMPDGTYRQLEQALQLPPAEKEVQIKPENLSLGEKQKIYLARLLAGGYGCLLLDEPGSNLDGQTERALVRMLGELKRTKLVLVISHNACYDAVADQIYQVRDQKLSLAANRNSGFAFSTQ